MFCEGTFDTFEKLCLADPTVQQHIDLVAVEGNAKEPYMQID